MMASSQAIITLCFLSGLLCSTVSACSSSGQHELYRVVRKTDEGGKQLVVATDEDARLYCRTNVPWKKCWWKPPRNGVRQVSFDILWPAMVRCCKQMTCTISKTILFLTILKFPRTKVKYSFKSKLAAMPKNRVLVRRAACWPEWEREWAHASKSRKI